MTCFGGKIGDLSGPGRCRIRPVYALSPEKLAPFIEVPWGECWVQHHRGVGSEPNSAFSFQGDLGKVAYLKIWWALTCSIKTTFCLDDETR